MTTICDGILTKAQGGKAGHLPDLLWWGHGWGIWKGVTGTTRLMRVTPDSMDTGKVEREL